MQFAYEFYAMALAIPALVVVARDSLAGAGPGVDALRAPRAPGRGARGRARRQAQAGRAGRAQRALRAGPGPPPPRAGARAPPRRAARPAAAPRPAGAAGADRVLRHLEPGRDLRRRLDGGLRGGAPAKSHYRTFSMRYEGGPDDFTRMREALRRRFARLRDPEDDPSFASVPGLVVIDGGKGQLAAAIEGMRESGVDGVPVVSLAKKREEVFRPGRSEPLLLEEGSAGAPGAAAHPRRGPPLRPAPPPRPAGQGDDRERARRPPGGRPRAQGGHPAPLRIGGPIPGRHARGGGGRAGGAVEGRT